VTGPRAPRSATAAARAPTRKPIPRYDGFDYRTTGAYFITTVTNHRLQVFGTIDDAILKPSQRGRIVERCWRDVPNHRPNVRLDAFVVMPNHFHAIVRIEDGPASAGDASVERTGAVGATPASPADAQRPPVPPGSLSAIIGAFKAAVSREINRVRPNAATNLWQRSFHDRIIRDEPELTAIRNCIIRNLVDWQFDEHNASARSFRTLDGLLKTLRVAQTRDT
jgi:hypothetical protein